MKSVRLSFRRKFDDQYTFDLQNNVTHSCNRKKKSTDNLIYTQFHFKPCLAYNTWLSFNCGSFQPSCTFESTTGSQDILVWHIIHHVDDCSNVVLPALDPLEQPLHSGSITRIHHYQLIVHGLAASKQTNKGKPKQPTKFRFNLKRSLFLCLCSLRKTFSKFVVGWMPLRIFVALTFGSSKTALM